MASPYFNSHSLYSVFQQAYESVVTASGLAFHDRSQQSGLVFGLRVNQTAPNNYVNPLIPYSVNFHNPFNDSRFKTMPVRVIYSQEFEQYQPSDFSPEPKAQPEDDKNNRVLASQSDSRTHQVLGMAGEAYSHSYSINTDPPPLTSTLRETAENGFDAEASASGSGESLAVVPDKACTQSGKEKVHHESEKGKASWKACGQTGKQRPLKKRTWDRSEAGKAYYRAYQKAYQKSKRRKAFLEDYEQSDKRKASRNAYEHTEKRKAAKRAWAQSEVGKAYYRAYRQSERGKAARKAYRLSEKGRAVRKAYDESEKGKANQKNYRDSVHGKAVRQAWANSEKGKESKLIWRNSERGKAYRTLYTSAYNKVFRHTGDKAQARIAGRQATAFMMDSNKAKNK